MFATPVVYPMSIVTEQWRWLVALNPMAPVIELFRFAFLGSGVADLSYWLVSVAVTIIVFILGAAMFNRIERSFVDTI
jgi:lipopolysaccharide transport system permease protein